MIIRLAFLMISVLALGRVASATEGSFEIFIDGVRTEYAVQSYPRLLDLKPLLPKDGPIDGLIWTRVSHQAVQARQREQCRTLVDRLGISVLPRDLFATKRAVIKNSLQRFVAEMRPTGRVLEYGSLDPIDLDASDFLNRKIRDGDQFFLDRRLELVWTWDYLAGWRERAHRPTNAAKAYGLEALNANAARGDWAYQISPSGKITLVGLARFNESTDAVPTGSVLFFPPPGFGRGNQAAYECLASLIATQIPSQFNARKWWMR